MVLSNASASSARTIDPAFEKRRDGGPEGPGDLWRLVVDGDVNGAREEELEAMTMLARKF